MAVVQVNPVFVHHPMPVLTAIPATANTNRDGTGTITSIYTADSTYGSVVESVGVLSTTNSPAAAVLNLFRSTDGGVTWRFCDQIAYAAASASTTVVSTKVVFNGVDWPLRLKASEQLGLSTTVAQAYHCTVQGGPLANSDS
jgi:hypothetical protein